MANFPSSPAKVKDQTQDARLHKTNNNMKDNAKATSMVLLEQRLVEGLDVALMTKQAHWNLKGPEFIGIHLMLDKFRGKQDDWNDMMAERIVQLGGTAKGTHAGRRRAHRACRRIPSTSTPSPTTSRRSSTATRNTRTPCARASTSRTTPATRTRRTCSPRSRAASTSSSGSSRRTPRSRPAPSRLADRAGPGKPPWPPLPGVPGTLSFGAWTGTHHERTARPGRAAGHLLGAGHRGPGGPRTGPPPARHVYRRHRRIGAPPPRGRDPRQRHGRGGRGPRHPDRGRRSKRATGSGCATTAAASPWMRIPSSRSSARSRSSSRRCTRAASSGARPTPPPAACTASAARS